MTDTNDRKRLNKTQFLNALAEESQLSKREVQTVLDALTKVVASELGSEGPGELTVPDLLKLSVKVTPAVPAGERMDPFTKEMRFFEAKPAGRKVRALPLKKLKDLV